MTQEHTDPLSEASVASLVTDALAAIGAASKIT